MLTAKIAYEKSLSAKAKEKEKILNLILKKIEEAAEQGETQIYCTNFLDKEILQSLKKLGFEIFDDYCYGSVFGGYYICWDLSDSKEGKEK